MHALLFPFNYITSVTWKQVQPVSLTEVDVHKSSLATVSYYVEPCEIADILLLTTKGNIL